MIVNLPMYASDEVKHWIRNREMGHRPSFGTKTRLRAQLYSAVRRVNSWNPSSTVTDTHHGGIFNFDFSPDGSLLVAACEGKSILMFDPLNGKLIKSRNQAHNDCVNCVRDEVKHWIRNREMGHRPSFGTKTRLRAQLYSAVRRVNSWNPSSTVTDTHHGGIFNFDFSPDGSLLVAACEGKSILMFDPLNGKLIKSRNQAHNDCVNCVRFLDSRTFATCSDDTTVCLWDARYLKTHMRSLKGHSNWVKNIEYVHNQGLLVTSGFDGSIYTWPINRYSDHDPAYQCVFHTEGLMRSKLTPDASKLVIATTGGYLMVVHNLDLAHLASDLEGFKPNLYRLMQMSGSALRPAYSYNHVFRRSRNRVELISDFHCEDEAEMVTSLEIHPQGWCAVSRNTAKEDKSEWTSVHDIQDRGPCTSGPVKSPSASPGSRQSHHVTEEPPGGGTGEEEDSGDEEGEDNEELDAHSVHSSDESNQSEDEEASWRRSLLSDVDLSSTIQSALDHVRSQFPGLDLHLTLQPSTGEHSGAEHQDGATRAMPDLHTLSSLISRPATRGRRVEFRFGLSMTPSSSSSRGEGGGANNDSGDNSSVTSQRTDNNVSSSALSAGGLLSSLRSAQSELRNTDHSTAYNERSQRTDSRVPPRHSSSTQAPSTSTPSDPGPSNSQRSVRPGDLVTLSIRNGAQASERTVLMVPSKPRVSSHNNPNVKIYQNRPRLTHYVPEPNVGRGFIKEVCFSNDGRLICSPFGYGIRLLAFDPLCNELCDTVPESPKRLYEVCDNMSHDVEVVTTKWSPTHPLIVSGCLNGHVHFHQPVF